MSDFESSPSYESVTINNSTTPQKVQIVTVTNNSTKENYKRMLSRPNESFNVGDIVVWNNLTFLVVDIDEDEQVQTKGKIQLCNNTLSFYSTTDSSLHTIHCIISSKLTLKDETDQYISSVDNQMYLIISDSTTNKEIQPDMIFKIGVYNYKILSVFDDVSNPGLLIFRLEYSEQEQEAHTYIITIQNSDTTLEVDDTCTLEIICTDNGSTVTTPTVTFSSSDIDIATVSTSGVITAIATGSAIITSTFNSVTDTITVTVQETVVDDFSVVVTGVTTVKLGTNITLNASVYNNGVLDDSKGVSWSISNQDLSSNVYVTLVSSSSSSITLKATSNSSYVGKYVVVRASKSDDSLVYQDFVVQLKALF